MDEEKINIKKTILLNIGWTTKTILTTGFIYLCVKTMSEITQSAPPYASITGIIIFTYIGGQILKNLNIPRIYLKQKRREPYFMVEIKNKEKEL